MNIFYLDRDPVIAAQMMCDKHVVKMILESAQMLSTAHRVLDGDSYADLVGMYKMAHKNHPSTIWVRSCYQHYAWLYQHMKALMQEYTYRYGKIHKCQAYIQELSINIPTLKEQQWTPPKLAMPDEYKGDDCVESYRQYYFFEKTHIHSWKGKIAGRDRPTWFTEFHKIFES